jgi:glycerol-3-phosphate acyltransferase PlsX
MTPSDSEPIASSAAASPVTVVVDAVGGDDAPGPVLEGAVAALDSDPTLTLIMTGPADVVEPFAAEHPRAIAHPTTEIIAMDEHPASAVRSKHDSSIVVGCALVKHGEAQAFFSAGSTGAIMAAGTLVTGRSPGVNRPAIAAVLPTEGGPVVLLDVGANADCRAEHLLQFAHMGSAYAATVLGIGHPRVALLNIGEEPSKGSQLAIEAHEAMARFVPGFVGNVEGDDILRGSVDVIVTDGFTGNVALKIMEGLSATLFEELKAVISSSGARRTAGAVLRPALLELRAKLDPDAYGGAPLLGVGGVVVIGHGSSGARAIANGIAVAARAARGGLPRRIADALDAAAGRAADGADPSEDFTL